MSEGRGLGPLQYICLRRSEKNSTTKHIGGSESRYVVLQRKGRLCEDFCQEIISDKQRQFVHQSLQQRDAQHANRR